MKKLAANTVLCMQPVPQTIVSCRDRNGRNNALVVGFAANASLDPVMVMVGIVPSRFSHHMVKETGCFVINLPRKSFRKEYNYLGSRSGRDEDKFAALDLKWEDAKYVNAPILTDCPVSIECSVVDSVMPGTHELVIGKVEAVHVDEEYLDANGTILWDKMDLM
ncbi:MAG: flavin reductase family protein [Oscillospiraceae bacterium]|nr:flavin reductase family protein [Oscillospiraceae bacterium]